MTVLQENYNCVLKNIEEACKKSGRDPQDVTLITVSKTKPLEMLRDVYEGGARHFGENKVQEMCEKMEQMPEDVNWHMIGHLQANKVKYLPGMACMIHSVDNIKLAQEIEKQFAKNDIKIDVLIEVNMAAEDTKFGLSPEKVIPFVKEISALPHLNIRGLMTIAPYTEDPESNRQYFRGLRELKDKINGMELLPQPMDTLSMGMTGDYQIAIEEGATFVRVGTGIFGERDYSQKK